MHAMSLDRRRFLHLATQSAGAVAIANSFGRPQSARAAAADPFVRLDGIAQAQAIAKGETTALELINAAIGRIERLNPKLNAVVTTDFDRARVRTGEQVQGPLRWCALFGQGFGRFCWIADHQGLAGNVG